MDNIFDTEESDIDLGFSVVDFQEDEVVPEEKQSKELQRNEDWDVLRLGSWNASETGKGLMTSSQKYSKISWNNENKWLGFSEGSIKYIFQKAKERETQRVIKTASTAGMKYGTIVENLTFRRANEHLKPSGLYLKKVGCKSSDEIPTLKASSDAVVCRIEDDVIVGSAEMKACISWGTVYERTFDNCNETSIDFWQTLQQMVVWNVSKNYYFVVTPPSSIMKYLNSEDIDEMYDEWCNETELETQIIEKSEIHAQNLIKRVKVAEETVQTYLKEKRNIKEILFEIIDREKGVSVASEFVNEDVTEATEEISEFERELLAKESAKQQTEEIINDFLQVIEEPKEEKQITSIEDLDDDLPF